MTERSKLIFVLILLFTAIAIDICIRLFYCQNLYLKFDSTEFNNIASPIIAFLGFIGVIVTIRLGINQLKHQQSSNYFDYYKNAINKFLIENHDDNLTTLDLLKFTHFCDDKYESLKQFPQYLIDVRNFKNGEDVSNRGKEYDNIQANLRYFRTRLHILLKRYSLMLDEILNHKFLSSTHKDLILKEFFETQITEYTTQLLLVDMDELKEIKENLYIGFANYKKETLPFYDTDLYELKNKVETDDRLKIHLEQ